MSRLGTAAALALLLASGLAACGAPKVEQDTVADIELRWYNNQSDITRATAEADTHCRAEGRKAVLSKMFIDQDVTIARFNCR